MDQTAQEVAQRSIGDLRLAVNLRVECGRELQCRPHEMPESLPERACEPDITIRYYTPRDVMETNDLVEEEPGGVRSVGGFSTGDEVCHLAEPVDDYQDSVQLPPRPG